MCDLVSKSKQGLRYHKQSIHLGIKYKCEQCDYEAKSKSMLNGHVQKIHEKKTFACEYCDIVLADYNTHKKHLMLKHHDKIKNYFCHLCNYRTMHKDLLQRHLTGKYSKHAGYSG